MAIFFKQNVFAAILSGIIVSFLLIHVVTYVMCVSTDCRHHPCVVPGAVCRQVWHDCGGRDTYRVSACHITSVTTRFWNLFMLDFEIFVVEVNVR